MHLCYLMSLLAERPRTTASLRSETVAALGRMQARVLGLLGCADDTLMQPRRTVGFIVHGTEFLYFMEPVLRGDMDQATHFPALAVPPSRREQHFCCWLKSQQDGIQSKQGLIVCALP